MQADGHPVWKWHRVGVLPATGTWCEAPVRERPLHPKPTKRIYNSTVQYEEKRATLHPGARGTEERLTHKAEGLRGSVEGLNTIESLMQRLTRTCSLELALAFRLLGSHFYSLSLLTQLHSQHTYMHAHAHTHKHTHTHTHTLYTNYTHSPLLPAI